MSATDWNPKNEYVNRYEVLNIINDAIGNNPLSYDGCVNEIMERVAKTASNDVRPVVLCKDCRHRDPEDKKCDCGGTERQGCPFKVADDYFCAYGEK